MIPLEALLADHQLYHSDFQMDSLITVRAGGTRYGCYKQALRELWKRYRGLRDLYSQQALLVIDIEELVEEVRSSECGVRNGELPAPHSELRTPNSFAQRRSAVHLASKRLALHEIAKNIEDTEREFLRFYAQAAALKNCLGELNPQRRAELDREMWEHKFKSAAAIDFMTAGRLSANTVESLQSCPVEMRKRLARDVLDPARHNSLIDWFLAYSPELPEFEPLAVNDVRRIVECSGLSPSASLSPNSSRTAAISSIASNSQTGSQSVKVALVGQA
jgi:hypothetical protein